MTRTGRASIFVGTILLMLCQTWSIASAGEKTGVYAGTAGHDYDAVCGICHDANGYGTQRLRERLGEEKAILSQRDDLEAPFIRQVVRGGYLAMPPLSRVAVSDKELEDIIASLTSRRGEE